MDKKVIITGAGQGLGFCLMKRHLGLGDVVYALDYKPTRQLLDLERDCGRLSVYRCDVSKTAEVEQAMEEPLRDGRQVDYLYNVAGIFRPEERGVTLKDIDLDAGLYMYDVNSVGPIRVCKAALPLIGKGSLLVTVSSNSGSIAGCRNKGEFLYNMSKAAVNMGMKILANELWEVGARVMLFHPGWLKTQMGGEPAAQSDLSITPEQSADDILKIVMEIDRIPYSQMYMEHNGRILPW